MQTNAIDAKRDPISFKEMQTMLKWSYGDEGLTLAESWRRWNERLWEGRLQPVPIIQPTATPYGHWIGLYSYNHENQSLSIQLKRGCPLSDKIDILLHEMVHQGLSESCNDPSHNAIPWCQEIIRITKAVWDIDIWASPSVPRKRDGRSIRIQKPSPNGEPSIPLKAIASWPHSLGLKVPSS